MIEKHYIVYELRFPDGSIYVGRTGQALDQRMDLHRRCARGNKKGGIRLAACVLRWPNTRPMVLWEGKNYYQSMGREIAAIKAAKRRSGMALLNRTRGGFYDPYDAGLLKSKKAHRR